MNYNNFIKNIKQLQSFAVFPSALYFDTIIIEF